METFHCRHRVARTPESSSCPCPSYDQDDESLTECELCDHDIGWHIAPVDLTPQQGRDAKIEGRIPLERCKDPNFTNDQNQIIPCPCPLFVPGLSNLKECKLCGHKQGWHRWKEVPLPRPQTPPLSPAASSASGGSVYGSFQAYNPHPLRPTSRGPPPQTPPSAHTQHPRFASALSGSPASPSPWSALTPPSPAFPYPSPQPTEAPQQPHQHENRQASTSMGAQPPGSPLPAQTTTPRRRPLPPSAGSSSTAVELQDWGAGGAGDDDLEEIVLPGGYRISPTETASTSSEGFDLRPPPSTSTSAASTSSSTPTAQTPLPTSQQPQRTLTSSLPPLSIPPARTPPPPPSASTSTSALPVRTPSTTARLIGNNLAPEPPEFYAPEPVQVARRSSPGPSQPFTSPVLPSTPPRVPASASYATYTHEPPRRTPVRQQSTGTATVFASPTAFRPGAVIPPDRERNAGSSGTGVMARRRGTSNGVVVDPVPATPIASTSSATTVFPRLDEDSIARGGTFVREDDDSEELANDFASTSASTSQTNNFHTSSNNSVQSGRSRGWSSGSQAPSLNSPSLLAGMGMGGGYQGIGGGHRPREDSVGSNDTAFSGMSGVQAGVAGLGLTGGNQVAGGSTTTLNLTRQASTLSVNSTNAAPGPQLWKEYETKSKNLTLAISPPLENRRFKPGQVFSLKLTLGSKCSLSSFDKIEVKLIGNIYIHNEPPDNHNFLSLTSSILPPSADVEQGRGQRTFTWNMMLPFDQTCDCRNEPLPLPPSYGHHVFYVSYMFKLTAKKHARFGLGNTEKMDAHFAVDAPFHEMNGLGLSPSSAGGLVLGVDGPWRTQTSHKVIRVDDQVAPVLSSELAWQIIHPPESSVVHIPYRVSLNFGTLPPSQYFNEAVLRKYSDALRIALSRKITLSKSGKSDGKAEERPLPTLLVTFKDRRENSGMVEVEGRSVWRCEGYLEAEMREARSLSTCSAAVRYMITAKALANVGLSHPIELFARNVNLELATAVPDPNALQRTVTNASITHPRRTSLLTEGFNNHQPIASGSGTRQQPQPQPFTLNAPPPGVQLRDGPRPSSTAGSSIYRIPLDQRGGGAGGAPATERGSDEWSIDTPPTGPPSVRSNPSPVVEEPPSTTTVTASGSGTGGGRLELPPDFDEEFGDDHEPTPAYRAYDDEEVP